MSERAKARAIALLLWLLVVVGASAARPLEEGLLGPDGIERVAVLGLLLAFASSRRLRALLAGIGAPRAFFVIALVCFVLWGQLARDNRASFPFLHWGMYTSRAPSNEYLDFEVRYRNGETGLFPFGELASFSGSMFLPSRGRALENGVAKWLRPEAATPDRARAELAKLAATYNRLHPGAPVVSMTVVRRVVPIRAFTGRETVRREPILELRFDE